MRTDEQIIENVKKRAFDPARRVDIDPQAVGTPLKPLADPAALAKLEADLGIVMPVLLKKLYLEVGDGEFGPGHGLYSAQNGIWVNLSLAELNRLEQQRGFWPDRLLPICEWGCGIQSCIDCNLPDYPMIFSDPNWQDPTQGEGHGFVPEQIVFRDWIAAWADDVDLWERFHNLESAEHKTRMHFPASASRELPQDLATLISMLGGDKTRIAALSKLQNRADDAVAAVPHLVKLLDNERDQLICTKTIRTLKAIGPPARAAVACLEKLLGDADLLIRLEAQSALKAILLQNPVPDTKLDY